MSKKQKMWLGDILGIFLVTVLYKISEKTTSLIRSG